MLISGYMMKKITRAFRPLSVMAFGLIACALILGVFFAPSVAISSEKATMSGSRADEVARPVQPGPAPVGQDPSASLTPVPGHASGAVAPAGRVGGGEGAPKLNAGDYPKVRGVNGRVAVWLAAQMHLWFAAFVLAVPIFVLFIEFIGVYKGNDRYDDMAYEFIRVSMTAYSVTAITGGALLFGLVVFYPDLMKYLSRIFAPTMLVYAILFFVETGALYVYYYGWRSMRRGRLKWAHLGVGLVLNTAGTSLMLVANAWVTFMMTPSGVSPAGVFDGNVWHAVNNHLWSPMNLHRFIANIAYGGSIVGAYAAYRFLSARTEEARAHYDWMGYTANLIAIGALLPLPFAGYWLTAEIYAYSQQMGINLMGGVFAWLFIIQAVIIGALFLAANYYLWCGFERSEGGGRYTPYIKYIAFGLLASFLVWFTPHSIVMTPSEAARLGSQYHPWLAPLGLMPAKNIAVNVMLLATFLSFLFYRRTNRVSVVTWEKTGSAIQAAIFCAGLINIVVLGVYYGYYTNSVYKVASSVPQVATTAIVIIGILLIEWLVFRGAKEVGPFKWGKMPGRSQYALVLIAVSFTWLMGLMGFVRSAIRQNWHVYSVMKDASVDAFTPTIAYAANVVSIGTVAFMSIVVFIFWLSRKGPGDSGKGISDEE